MRCLSLSMLALVTVVGFASAQCAMLSNFGAVTGQKGCMFDIENISGAPVTILGFDQSIFPNSASPCVLEIYTHSGTFLGTQSTAAAWGAPIGVNPSLVVTVAGANTAVPTGIPISVTIPSGATQAFWITCTGATATPVLYSTGPTGGLCGIMATDGVINLRRGVGKTYPLPGTTFGMTAGQLCGQNAGRSWNGRVYYQTGVTASWEVNSPTSSLTVNGQVGTGCLKASTTLCAGSAAAWSFDTSLAGMPFEVVYNTVPTVAAGSGALLTPNLQIVNLDLLGGLYFLNGGSALSLSVPHPGSLPVAFAMPPVTLSAQQLVIDPTHPDSFSLSQASEVNGVAPSPSMPGPTGDDATLTLTAGTAPLCSPALLVYGTLHTRMYVSTNGWVNFTAVNNTFTPTVATFLTQRAAGLWCDLNTAAVAGGNLVVSSIGTVVTVNWNGVGYYNTAISNTFSISTDTSTGVWSLSGLSGVSVHTANQLVGMSPGAATDPGMATFAPIGSSGGAVAATDAIYNFGTAGAGVAGLNDIIFTPDGLGNYTWLSQ